MNKHWHLISITNIYYTQATAIYIIEDMSPKISTDNMTSNDDLTRGTRASTGLVLAIFARNTHYCDVIMGAMASQLTSLTTVYSTVYSGTYKKSKHQSSASLAFVRGIHRLPVNSPHKWPETRKMFPFDDVIMTGASTERVQELMSEACPSSFSFTIVQGPEFTLL